MRSQRNIVAAEEIPDYWELLPRLYSLLRNNPAHTVRWLNCFIAGVHRGCIEDGIDIYRERIFFWHSFSFCAMILAKHETFPACFYFLRAISRINSSKHIQENLNAFISLSTKAQRFSGTDEDKNIPASVHHCKRRLFYDKRKHDGCKPDF